MDQVTLVGLEEDGGVDLTRPTRSVVWTEVLNLISVPGSGSSGTQHHRCTATRLALTKTKISNARLVTRFEFVPARTSAHIHGEQ